MYSKKYLCHTWQDGKLVGSRRFDSLVSLKQYLRRNGARFSNDYLSDLDEDSVEINSNEENIFYEIEALAEEIPDYIVSENIHYVSLPLWARQHGLTISKANSLARSMKRVKRGERLYVEMGGSQC